jgi:hypothetical protein
MKAEELMFAMLPLKSMDGIPDDHSQVRAEAFGIDVSRLEYLLSLTPAERVRRHDAALALVLAARGAGIKCYGFDPRSPEVP